MEHLTLAGPESYERTLPITQIVKPRVLLAQRACVESYPPTLNQAALLSDCADVTVLDAVTEEESGGTLTASEVRRIRVARRHAASAAVQAMSRLQWLGRFFAEFQRQLATAPDVAIAYDPEAAWYLLRRRWGRGLRRPLRIVHLHEMPLPEYVARSPVGRFALRATLKHLRRADLVVLPDRHRAEYAQRIAGLARLPLVVMNCPRRLEHAPASQLLPFLRKRGITSSNIVHYQGAVGPHHGLKNVIRSMRLWPSDAVFVIVGAAGSDYQRDLAERAEAEGVHERVIFVGRVPYDRLFSFAVGARVGITLLDGAFAQWRFAAGASNKRFEYASLGIPQVTNDLPGVRELFVDSGLALLAAYDAPESIGKAISCYLEDEALRRTTSQRARALHLSCYNYEWQFQPVLDILRAPQEQQKLS